MESNSAVTKVDVKLKAKDLAVKKAEQMQRASMMDSNSNSAVTKVCCSHLHRMVPSWPPLDHS